MAYTGKTGSLVRNQGGVNSEGCDRGIAQFDGTSLSLELPVTLLTIRPGSLLQVLPGTTTPTSVERVFIREVVSTDGHITVPTSGEITIGRQVEVGGTQTTDLQFFFCLRGPTTDY
jgi:hypothetical protein